MLVSRLASELTSRAVNGDANVSMPVFGLASLARSDSVKFDYVLTAVTHGCRHGFDPCVMLAC